MASSLPLLLLLLSLLFSSSSAASRPNTLVVPITKYAETDQYVAHVRQRTPLIPIKLVIDLGGRYVSVYCGNYNSSTYRPTPCSPAQCEHCGGCPFYTPGPGCSNNNTCYISAESPIAHSVTGAELATDVLSLPYIHGGKPAATPTFLFACSEASILELLARNAQGMAGLGRSNLAMPAQLSAAFGLAGKFGLCLPATSQGQGVIFFGDVTLNNLIYTPLLTNPVDRSWVVINKGQPSIEYFVGLKSIKLAGRTVPINTALLSIGKDGVGGTKISTVTPYTILESSIYKALTGAFLRSMSGTPMAAARGPLQFCYDEGLLVPAIDFVMDGASRDWSMGASNTMVRVSNKVLCLAFVDGGDVPVTAVVIGGHQLQDNLLQFDLAASRLGFTGSLSTPCTNFDFTQKV